MALSLPSSSSSSSSSFASKWSHDVFLSFRGEDTRNSFISHLYSALCQNGIKTYKDDINLERGESISLTLIKVIEESMISIIVLSTNYASSTWCLDELTKILECKNTKQQIVLPVFYHVDPSEVRNQRKSFGEELTKHQERFKEDTKVQKWKAALEEVSKLAGEHLLDGNESEFIQKMVQWVSSKINKSRHQLNIPNCIVGVGSRVKDLNALLKMERNDITLMIGIYGVGGIGKTTIAKVAYNSIAEHFEDKYFLKIVRETSSRGDDLGKILHYEVFGDSRNFNVGSVGGINFIKQMFRYKRVLLMLDDVNELHQLQELAGDHNWFGLGSRIIITTRDQHLLRSHGVDSMYEVLELDNNEAIQLFSCHAFKRDMPVESYAELTKCIIGYAKGLPLALIVLGSYLRDRNIQEWKSTLEKYKRSLHKDIYEILRISYDGLDDNEKDIFLDIACFFKGRKLNYVNKILDQCGFSSTIGIARLRDKCLVDIGKFNDELEMHDLLQEMGKEIVRQESPKEAGERSRLWFYEDVLHVLEGNTGTNKVEGILLDLPENHDEKIVRLHSKAFNPMKNLRMLINRNAEFSTGPNYLSNELRVLYWPNYPSPFLPSNFYGKKLTIFRMPGGLIKELDGLKAKNMTRMELAYCKFLTRIPDLSSSPNLEYLDLQGCENLVEIHHSVGFLDKLSSLFVGQCCKLRIFPKRLKLRSLRWLQLFGCWSLEDFPEIESEMALLHQICLRGTSIKELPSSIENLSQLVILDLRNTSIKELPSSIGNLTQLEVLDLSRSSIIELPSSIGNLTLLKEIYASDCKNLMHLPSSIDQLRSLDSFIFDGCSQLINFGKMEEDGTLSTASVMPTGECEIASTVELTPIKSSISNYGSSWKYLSLKFCCLSESNIFVNNYFPNLVDLNLSGSDIVVFSQSVRFDGLRYLYLNNCKQLKEIRTLPSSIEKVEARGCTSLESFAEISEIFFENNPSGLRIDLYGCYKLRVEMGLPSPEQRGFKEQNCLARYLCSSKYIIYPGKRIPKWFSYSKEVHDDSNSCEIDINGPQHWDDIDILLCFVFGLRVGINPEMNETGIRVRIYGGTARNMLFERRIIFNRMDSDHVWMELRSPTYGEAVLTSRFRFEWNSKDVVFRSVGVHFLKKHEERARYHPGASVRFGKRRRDDENGIQMTWCSECWGPFPKEVS